MEENKPIEIPVHVAGNKINGQTKNGHDPERSAYQETNWEDAYQRLATDFSNYKRRTEEEFTHIEQRTRAEIIKSLLPVYDNFLRLVGESAKLDKGIYAVLSSWQTWLQMYDVKKMQLEGRTFNPDYHEAVMQIPAPEAGLDGKIMHVIENGYMMGNMVLRHAKVGVGRYEDSMKKSLQLKRQLLEGERENEF